MSYPTQQYDYDYANFQQPYQPPVATRRGVGTKSLLAIIGVSVAAASLVTWAANQNGGVLNEDADSTTTTTLSAPDLTPREALELDIAELGITFTTGSSAYGAASEACNMLDQGFSPSQVADSGYNASRRQQGSQGITRSQASQFVNISIEHLCPLYA